MKILVLSRSTQTIGINGGMEVHLTSLAEYFVKNGCEVDVVTTAHPGSRDGEIINGVNYFYLLKTKTGAYRGGWFKESKKKADELMKANKYHVVWSQSIAALAVLGLFKKQGISVIGICHGTFYDELTTNIRRESNIIKKIIVTLDFFKILIKYLIHIYYWHKLSGIISVSRIVKQKMINQYFLKPPSIAIIYNGVDIDKFTPFNGKKENIILSLGRLVKEKGHHFSIEIVKKLIDEGVSARLLIIGDGDRAYKDFLLSMIKRYNLVNNIELKGYVEDLKVIFDRTKLLLMPTLQNEAFGIVAAESMACGIPVIAFNNGSLREIIDDGVNGFLVESKNIDQACIKIKKILNDENKYSELSKNARLKVQQCFSLDKMGEESLKYFKMMKNNV